MSRKMAIEDVLVTLAYPEGWLPLDPAPEDVGLLLDDWLQVAFPQVSKVERELSRAMLTRVRLAMDDPFTVRRATLVPHPLAPPVITFEVRLFPWDRRGPLTVEEMREVLRGASNPVGEPEVSIVDLAPGPAVRRHWMWRDDSMGSSGATVCEGVRYVVLPRRTDGFVIAEGAWVELAYGGELTEHVDAMVQGLRLERAAERAGGDNP